MTHLRVIEDSTNIFIWYLLPQDEEEFKEQFGDFFAACDFQGAKLTKDEEKKWFRAFRIV